MFMIMLVLDKPRLLDKLLESWQQGGINGATIVDSTGIQRQLKKRADLHLHYLFTPVSVGAEHGNLTLFVIVEEETMIQKCLEATEMVTGDLELPDSGVFAVWPLSFVKGIHKGTAE